jgi:hypothetical protein
MLLDDSPSVMRITTDKGQCSWWRGHADTGDLPKQLLKLSGARAWKAARHHDPEQRHDISSRQRIITASALNPPAAAGYDNLPLVANSAQR